MFGSSRITVTLDGGTLTISPRGEIDHHSARSLRDRIDNEMYLNRPAILILDLSGVDFMDSSGLGLLLGRYQRASEIGCDLKLAGCSARTKKILELSGADKLFDFLAKA
ncbi:MAG: STAS domain-containing protein [Clostridia bacterium]|nr:STAS domain-containing protein [Clostridia bacterium]